MRGSLSPWSQAFPTRTGALLLSALLVACSANPPPPGPPPRGAEVLTGFTEPLTNRPGFDLFLRNNTDGPVTVVTLTLFQCENVMIACRTREPSLVLEPGEVERVARVEPALGDLPFRYRWRWTYQRGAVEAGPDPDEAAPTPVVLYESEAASALLDPRGRVLNLVLSDELMAEITADQWTPEIAAQVSRKVLDALDDVFDFLLIAMGPDEGVAREVLPRAFHVGVRVQGIGLSVGNRAAEFGSNGWLRGVLFLPDLSRFDSQIPLHELAHLWGQYIFPESASYGHWGFSGVGGHLGGWTPGTLEQVSPEAWVARGPGTDASFTHHGVLGEEEPYAPLELYLMGLLPPDSVPPVQLAEGAEWISQSVGMFRADSIRTVTIEDIVAEHGPREPAFPEAPSTFRGAFVVLSSSPLSGGWRNRLDEQIEAFARPGPSPERRFLNFWEATGGRGNIVMGDLDAAVQEGR